MAWLSFLKSKDFDPSKFEKELSTLAKRISQHERNVSKYTYQSQRMRRFVISYGVLTYVIYIAYLSFITRLQPREVSLWQWISIVIVPMVLFFLSKAITSFYTMRINRTQLTIEALKEEHAEKIEELKEKTKYSSTQALLNRFADAGDLNAQLDEELLEKKRQLDEITRLSLEQSSSSGTTTFNAYPQRQSRGWFDLIVDSLVGSDELSPNNRYALICPNCSSHNGLAPPGQEASTVVYRCPNCEVFNGQQQQQQQQQQVQPAEVITQEILQEPVVEHENAN